MNSEPPDRCTCTPDGVRRSCPYHGHLGRYVARSTSPAYCTPFGNERVVDFYVFDRDHGYRVAWHWSAQVRDPRAMDEARRAWRVAYFALAARSATRTQ